MRRTIVAGNFLDITVEDVVRLVSQGLQLEGTVGATCARALTQMAVAAFALPQPPKRYFASLKPPAEGGRPVEPRTSLPAEVDAALERFWQAQESAPRDEQVAFFAREARCEEETIRRWFENRAKRAKAQLKRAQLAATSFFASSASSSGMCGQPRGASTLCSRTWCVPLPWRPWGSGGSLWRPTAPSPRSKCPSSAGCCALRQTGPA